MTAPYGPETHRRRRLSVLAEAQNWRCCYCGIRCQINPRDPNLWDAPSCEHVLHLGRGGLRVWENEVMACRLCNTGRGRMHPLQYLKKVVKVGRWKAYKWSMRRLNRRRQAWNSSFGGSRSEDSAHVESLSFP